MQNPLLHTPLIHPRVWGKRLPTAAVPPEHAALLASWAAAIRDKSIFKRKETELRGAFLEQIFVKVLGYTQFGTAEHCTLLTEQRAGTGSMDAALGQFSSIGSTIIAPFEIKGTDTRNLDAIMPGRHKSPVTQAWEYALDTPSTQLLLVSNMLEIRVYAMGCGRQAYERFDLLEVADSAREYWRFMAVLAAPALLAGELQTLLADSASTERDITQQLYLEYKTLRLQTIIALHQANGGEPGQYITLAQKILDRVLFVAFCEDRGLLPEKLLERVIKSRNAFAPQPHWDALKRLFQFVDTGHAGDPLISAYNGGLFAPDARLDGLHLPDDACTALAALGKYDFASDVPVTVLGHIFEQSIDDLEKLQALVDVGRFGLDQLQAQLQTKPKSVTGQRKTDGIVYTPDFITRFMVQHTVGKLLDERLAKVRAGFEVSEPSPLGRGQGFTGGFATHALRPANREDGKSEGGEGGGEAVSLNSDRVMPAPSSQPFSRGEKGFRPPSKQELKDYKTLVLDPARIVEYLFWQAWHAELKTIKICDPACGSGAFLIAAFEVLEPAYQAINEATQSITGSFDLFDTDRDILTGNLYGVDLNSESIEISQLSLWLKTAKRGKKLENLSHTLKVGNSLIGTMGDGARYSDKAFDWQTAFPEVVAQGGFDAVIGNPPYVRMEVLKPFKPYLEAHYTVASDRADLYAYFFEQGVRLLRSGGLLGYISSSTFFKTGSGEPLRRYLSANTALQTVVDFGDLQVFEGVTTYPAIVVTRKIAVSSSVRAEPVEALGEDDAALQSVTSPSTSSGRTDLTSATVNPHTLQFLQLTDTLPKDLGTFFDTQAQTMPQASLHASGWQFEDRAAAALRRKLTEGHATLKDVYGSPLRGIVTGLNEAFVLSQAQYDDIVSADPSAAGLLKPFLEGKDLKKWRVEPQNQWLIYIPKNSIDIDDYPSIKAHLLPFKAKLEARATKQAWFELQQAQEAYQARIEAPKILYPDLSQGSKFGIEPQGAYFGNTAYFIPSEDKYLLSLLNAKATWFYLRGVCEAMRGGEWRLRMFTQNIEDIPIPTATEAQRNQLAALAQQAQTAAQQRRDVLKAFGHQVLRDLAPGGATAKLPTALHDSVPPFADFTVLVKERFKKELTLSQRNDWEAALNQARAAVTQHTRSITAAEAAIDQLVYTLFDLTAAEIALIEA
jgi:TaqI-like C-terminal specificity domain/Eco57I restriction-modification methylase